MKIDLKFWQSGTLARKIADVLELAWANLAAALVVKLSRLADPELCPDSLLDLLGWQRGVDRLAGEDDDFYRLRVKYAYLNARDAGSAAGFEAIWARLGLGTIAQTEHPMDGDNWDVITVQVDYGAFAQHIGLWDELIRLYGRTCRRYQLTTAETPASLDAAAASFEVIYSNSLATYGD